MDSNFLNDPKSWDTIKAAYLMDTSTKDPNLSREVGIIKNALKAFDPSYENRYIINGFLGVGGVGIVFKVWDKKLGTNRAIKIARPIDGKEELISDLVIEEISNIQEVSHPNLISIFDVGILKSESGDLPFYIMTYLEGAVNAYKYFSEYRTREQFLKFIDCFFNGINYLHSKKLVHLDIKPKNVFVREDGFSIIGDLGGARKIDGKDELVRVTCTTGYAHPYLEGKTELSTSGEQNRLKGSIMRSELDYRFDRYSIGKSLFEIIALLDDKSPTSLSQYQRKYLSLQAARMLDGETKSNERPIGLTEKTLKKIKYESTEEICIDFEKLIGRLNLLNEIPELTSMNENFIQVTKGRKTRITPRLTILLNEPLLRRLGSVSQLGLIRLVYPGATHTRFEHSLGTYSNAAEYLRALYNDPINPFFRQIMSKEDLIATLLAALLHDLGQFQHAHDLQSVDPKIFDHENFAISLLNATWTDYRFLTEPLRKKLNDDWGISADRIIKIFAANIKNSSVDIKDRILHTIISGPLDADKLDYLLRDSDHCQIVFGSGIDRSRLLSTLTIVYERVATDEQYFALGIHEKGRAAAESLGFIRFQMFRALYWHHAVRAAKSMLQRAVYEWIASQKPVNNLKDILIHDFQDFVLGKSSIIPSNSSKRTLFDEHSPVENEEYFGHSMRPEWSYISHTDFLALRWFYYRTTLVGKYLINAIARRELYKRIFVISSYQDNSLWNLVQNELSNNYPKVKEKSEELRKALKSYLDEKLKEIGKEPLRETGVGIGTEKVINASNLLNLEGTVLLDVPNPRSKEKLYFSPEDLHRGQREAFEADSLLSVSELWKLLSDNLHETAGNIRVFVHPQLDILRTVKTKDNRHLLDSKVLEEEVRKVFQ